MNHKTYCFWLILSTAMGNQLSLDECHLLNAFLRKQNP